MKAARTLVSTACRGNRVLVSLCAAIGASAGTLGPMQASFGQQGRRWLGADGSIPRWSANCASPAVRAQ